ncbi:MAG: PilZ domain-containing protein [Phycisphaerales bacterium]|nr:PilZ domain-containing protein [Phycisphaerales bacterium]
MSVSDFSRNEVEAVIEAAMLESTSGSKTPERRVNRRLPYAANVVIVPVGPQGKPVSPIVVRAVDVSTTGLRLDAGTRIEEGMTGAVQMLRPSGQLALLGFIVRNYRGAGASHEVGIEFTKLPETMSADDFVDEHGRLKLLDPALLENCHGGASDAA